MRVVSAVVAARSDACTRVEALRVGRGAAELVAVVCFAGERRSRAASKRTSAL